MMVTATGAVDTARTTISPPFPPAYDKAFKKRLLQWDFWPALSGEYAVEAAFPLTLDFHPTSY